MQVASVRVPSGMVGEGEQGPGAIVRLMGGFGGQCSLQDFAIGGYILECTKYLHYNLMCFVIQVIILVALWSIIIET